MDKRVSIDGEARKLLALDIDEFGGGEVGGADAAEGNSLDDNIFQQTEN